MCFFFFPIRLQVHTKAHSALNSSMCETSQYVKDKCVYLLLRLLLLVHSDGLGDQHPQ